MNNSHFGFRFFLLSLAVSAAPLFAQDASRPDMDVSAPDTEITVPEDDGQDEALREEKGIPVFPSVVKANWEAWAGVQGTVTWAALVPLMGDPSIKGADAAALAALVRHSRRAKAVPLSLDEAAGLSDKKILSFYVKAAVKLKNLKRVLFASGKPDFNKLQQGPATDCYFFSGTGWIARNRPDVITKAIKEVPGKGYNVVFPDGQEALVSQPTDAEIAYNDSPSTLSDGIWMPVLLKAEGIIEGRHSARRAEIADPSLRVDVGGGPAAIVKRWTGNDFSGFNLGDRAEREAVREGFIRMQRFGLMAEALSFKHPDGKLIGNHCYAIFAFDAKTDMLTVWNPWGNDFKPRGPSGPEFGFARKSGIFEISLDDFIRLYSYLAIEKP